MSLYRGCLQRIPLLLTLWLAISDRCSACDSANNYTWVSACGIDACSSQPGELDHTNNSFWVPNCSANGCPTAFESWPESNCIMGVNDSMALCECILPFFFKVTTGNTSTCVSPQQYLLGEGSRTAEIVIYVISATFSIYISIHATLLVWIKSCKLESRNTFRCAANYRSNGCCRCNKICSAALMYCIYTFFWVVSLTYYSVAIIGGYMRDDTTISYFQSPEYASTIFESEEFYYSSHPLVFVPRFCLTWAYLFNLLSRLLYLLASIDMVASGSDQARKRRCCHIVITAIVVTVYLVIASYLVWFRDPSLVRLGMLGLALRNAMPCISFAFIIFFPDLFMLR